MRQIATFALLVLVPLGCCHPLKLMTTDRVTVGEPVTAQVKVETETPFLGHFKVQTEGPILGHVKLESDKPLAAAVTTDTPPTRTAERVVPMPLSGCVAGCEGKPFPKVALIDVDGLLLNQNMAGFASVGDNPVTLFKEKLDAAASDVGVCAVVLRINTPGGAVNASDVMFHELQSFRTRTHLPVVACVLDVAAGGGYLLASGSDLVFASPTSVVGGVGVIWNSYNLREALALQNIFLNVVKSGEQIDMGTVLNKLPDSVKKMFQSMADEYHQYFKTQIRQMRPRIPERCTVAGDDKVDVFDGRVVAGGQALSCGLIDRLGYLDDAIAAAREMAHQPDASLVLFHRANDPAFSPYTITANTPVQNTVFPLSIPGADRSKLPTFLFMWLPEPTVERLSGR